MLLLRKNKEIIRLLNYLAENGNQLQELSKDIVLTRSKVRRSIEVTFLKEIEVCYLSGEINVFRGLRFLVSAYRFHDKHYRFCLSTMPGNHSPAHGKFIPTPMPFWKRRTEWIWGETLKVDLSGPESLINFLNKINNEITLKPVEHNDVLADEEPEIKKKFELKKNHFQVKRSEIPSIETKPIPGNIIDEQATKSNFKLKISPGFLFWEPQATTQLQNHIGWETPTPANRIEQGGLLIGKVFKTPKNTYWAVVQTIIPAQQSRGTATALEMTHEDWKYMLDQLDHHQEARLVIGWYHTHPNNLDIFMSGVDMTTQRSMFREDWQFAVVLNPQRNIWGVFRGAEAISCKGYFLNRTISD